MENECWSGSNPSPKEVEYFIHNVTDAKDDLMYGLHSIGRSYANHFSEIKLKYKKLALTWLSSLLIGLFFITQSNGSSSLQSLNKNVAFVKLPGKAPVTKLKLKYLHSATIA
ncbi:MAG: hypothetical protein H6620_09880 [Halobacteriovoraceae bacterium]|nr:hypothetical protein [Halobacteriovoraceae bacterium]